MRGKYWICAVLALLTVAVYWPLTHSQFISLDDPNYVADNPHVLGGLTEDGVVWALTTGYASNWHPLTWISHMLDCQLYGLNAGDHHLTSLLFHTTNAVLLFLLLLRMTGTAWRSAVVAALFAWHPLHVESVAWISERKDVLSTFFFLLTLMAYASYVRDQQGPKSRLYYGLALGLYALALMSKPMVVTLPFLLLLLDYWPLGRSFKPAGATFKDLGLQTQTGILMEKLPFFLLAGASSAVTLLVQKAGGAVVPTEMMPISGRVANAVVSYLRYLKKMIWPDDLAVFYPALNSLTVWHVAGAFLLLAAITVVVVRFRRDRPWLLVGWFWFLGTLVPVIGLVQVGSQSMADRYSYIPLIGVFIMVVWELAGLVRRWPAWRSGVAAAAVAILAACLALTWFQVRLWKNSVNLFEHALAVTGDNNGKVQYSLGLALVLAGRLDDGLPHFQKAVELLPYFADAHNNFGRALLEKGRLTEAIQQFQDALRLKSDHTMALANLNQVAWVMATCPEATLRNGPEALELARELDQWTGGSNPVVMGTLAAAFAENGQFSDAIATARHALQLAKEQDNAPVAGALEEQLKSYQANQPFRDRPSPR